MTSSQVGRLGNAPEEGMKAPCRVSTVVNITLNGEQSINGVAVVAGDRVLVRAQTLPAENGIYLASTGAWERATDWNRANDVISGVVVMDDLTGVLYKSNFTGTYSAGVTEVTYIPTGTGGASGGGGGSTGTYLADPGDGIVELWYEDSDGNLIQITNDGLLNVPAVYTFPVQGSDPTPVASAVRMYTKTVASTQEVFIRKADGSVIQLTNGAGLGSVQPEITDPDSADAHTATAANNGRMIVFNTSSNITVTLPQFSTEELNEGFYIIVKNDGTGNISFVAEGVSDTIEGCPLVQLPGEETAIYIKNIDGSNNYAWSTIGNIWEPRSVVNTTQTAPPATPDLGAVYIVASPATGGFLGQENKFAIHVGSDVYFFQSPEDGHMVRDQFSNTVVLYDGTDTNSWIGFGFGSNDFGTTVTPNTATTHTVVGANANGIIFFNSVSDCVVTLPQFSTEALGAGFPVYAVNLGGGRLTYAFQGSDTLESGVREVFDPTKPSRARCVVSGSPNNWIIDQNDWPVEDLISYTLTAPPATPAVGAKYYVLSPATGAWAGKDGMVAIHVGSDVYDFQKLPPYLVFRHAGNGHLEVMDTSSGSIVVSVS